jgi:two-component system, chemotaxis family, sensor kinase CheA
MTSSEEAFLKKLRAAFVSEAQEQVGRISSGLSSLPDVGDSSTKQIIIENTFRELHNMKGSARAVNLLNLETVCQSLEDVFSAFKRAEREITPKLLDTMHEVVDAVSELLTKCERDDDFDTLTDLTAVLQKLKNLHSSDIAESDLTAAPSLEWHEPAGSVQVSHQSAMPSPASDEPDGSIQSSNQTVTSIPQSHETASTFDSNQAEPPTLEWNQPIGSIANLNHTVVPNLEWSEPATSVSKTRETSETAETAETAASILNEFVFPMQRSSDWSASTPFNNDSAGNDPLKNDTAKSAPSLATALAPPQVVPPDASREVVRIASAKLDELLMRAEDMLSLKIMSRQHNQDLNNVGFKFDTYSRDWNKVYADVRAARQLLDRDEGSAENQFIEAVLTRVLEFLDLQQQQMGALSNQLINLKSSSLNDYRVASGTVDTFLENTKKLLMMPASTMLELMPKLVRDLARELGKEVDLTIQGSTIQLDKRVLAQIKDPIVHILRNSIDHGLEKPERRIQAGKSPRGLLNISLLQHGGNTVEIVIRDDGAGIDIEKIKEIAIKNQLLNVEQAKQLTDEEATSLIFQSSFSTSSTVSEISGRGLGLAIAKENIVNLGGRLQVESGRGFGTTFRITLPVTIATFRGVLIKCAGETLIVPTSDMERVMKVRADQVQTTENGRTINVDGHQIPLVRLDDALELPMTPSKSPHHLVMVLRNGESSFAFEINDVLEEQEVLVKKLSKPLIRVRNVAGVTILGSGKLAPILNVRDLLKSANKLSGSKTYEFKPPMPVQQKRILVVDDTITARILMKNILESAGYVIKTANDGTEALKLLAKEKFDLLVTDIEMPKMNGIELTAAVRNDIKISSIPIILVTSMTDQHYREKGTEAGANAFFVKSSFDQNNLVDVIKQLI